MILQKDGNSKLKRLIGGWLNNTDKDMELELAKFMRNEIDTILDIEFDSRLLFGCNCKVVI